MSYKEEPTKPPLMPKQKDVMSKKKKKKTYPELKLNLKLKQEAQQMR